MRSRRIIIKKMKGNTIKSIGRLSAFLVILSLLLFGIEQIIFLIVARTDFSDHMATMFSMLLLSFLLLLMAKRKKVELSVFPEKFSKWYIIFTMIAVILLITTPSNYTGRMEPILLLIYSSIVVPFLKNWYFEGLSGADLMKSSQKNRLHI